MSFDARLEEVSDSVTKMRRTKDTLLHEQERTIKQKKEQSKKLLSLNSARVVVQEVAQQTQANLEYYIAELASIALDSVFPENLAFKANIIVKRNQTELEFLLLEEGKEMSPTDNSGGAADVIALSLRVMGWSLAPNRPILFLDEPCKYVSPDLQEKLSLMIKKISEIMNIQIIMVSHADDINMAADKTFIATKEKGVTKINGVYKEITG